MGAVESVSACGCVGGQSTEELRNLIRRCGVLEDHALSLGDLRKMLGVKSIGGCQNESVCFQSKFKEDVDVDSLQLVAGAVALGNVALKTKLKLLFEHFDMERKGFLGNMELYLLFDTALAGIETFGHVYGDLPQSDDIELAIAVILERSSNKKMISRSELVNTECVLLNRFLQNLDPFRRCPPFHKPEFSEQDLGNQVRVNFCQKEPSFVCGANIGFFMGSEDELVRIAGPFIVHERSTFRAHTSSIKVVSFSWMHGAILTACKEKVVLWKWPSLKPSAPLYFHNISSMFWSEYDCVFALINGGDGSLYLFDGELNEIYSFDLQAGRALSGVFTTGSNLVICGRNGYLEAISPKNNSRRMCSGAPPEIDFVSSAFNSKSKLTALGGSDGKLYVLDEYRIVRCEEAGNPDGERLIALQSCERGFATGCPNKSGSLRLWSLNLKMIAEFFDLRGAPSIDFGATMICWSPSGEKLCVTTKGGEIFVMNSSSGQILECCSGHLGVKRKIPLNEGQFLTLGSDSTMRLWFRDQLVSTCFLETMPFCVGTSGNWFAVGVIEGVQLIKREERAWELVKEWKVEGLVEPKTVSISPDHRFIVVDDVLIDVDVGLVHGKFPIVAEAIEWLPNEKKTWHVCLNGTHRFEIVLKSMFTKKAIKLLENELYPINKRVENGMPPLNESTVLLEDTGVLIEQEGFHSFKNWEGFAEFEENLFDCGLVGFLEKEFKSAGVSGHFGNSVAKIGEIVAYVVYDCIVLKGPRSTRVLTMHGEVAAVQSAADNYILGFDGRFLCIWEINVSLMDCILYYQLPLPRKRVCGFSLNEQLVTFRMEGSGYFAVRHSPCSLRLFALPCSEACLVSLLPNSSVLVSIEGKKADIFKIEGQQVKVLAKQSLSSVVKLLDKEWMVDEDGSILAVEGSNVSFLNKNCHEGRAVQLLKNKLTACEAAVVRQWSHRGELLKKIDCKQLGKDVFDLCGNAFVLNGHVLMDINEKCITESHATIQGILPFGNSGILSLGKTNATVCHWNKSDLSLKGKWQVTNKLCCCRCAALSSGEDRIAFGMNEGSVIVWKIEKESLASKIASLSCGTEEIIDLSWAPTQDCDARRLVVLAEDLQIYFLDPSLSQVRIPVQLSGLVIRPVKVEFADNCELVRIFDNVNFEVYADSVSANLIPEERIDANWCKRKKLEDCIDFIGSSLRLKAHMKSIALTWPSESQKGSRTCVKMLGAFGTNTALPRFYNQIGELLHIAGDCLLARDLWSGHQRIVGSPFGFPIEKLACFKTRAVVFSPKSERIVVLDSTTGKSLIEYICKCDVHAFALLSESCPIVFATTTQGIALFRPPGHAFIYQIVHHDEILFGSVAIVDGVIRCFHAFEDRVEVEEFEVKSGNPKLLKRVVPGEDQDGNVTCFHAQSGALGYSNGVIGFLGNVLLSFSPFGSNESAIRCLEVVNELVAVANEDGCIRVWRNASECVFDCKSATVPRNLLLDHLGTVLIDEFHLMLLEDGSKKELSFVGHQNTCTCVCSSRRNIFLSGSQDETLKKWHASDGKVLQTCRLGEGVIPALLAIDDKMQNAFCVSNTNEVFVIDLEHFEVMKQTRIPEDLKVCRITANDESSIRLELDDETKDVLLHFDLMKFSDAKKVSNEPANPAREESRFRIIAETFFLLHD